MFASRFKEVLFFERPLNIAFSDNAFDFIRSWQLNQNLLNNRFILVFHFTDVHYVFHVKKSRLLVCQPISTEEFEQLALES